MCFEYLPKSCTHSTGWLLHGWCHVKLLLSWCILCMLYNHAPHHATSCKATYIGYSSFSCNMPPALLAEWPGSFTCYCGNMGVEWILKWVITKHWPWWRKFLLFLLGLEPTTFWSWVWCSNHCAIPTVWYRCILGHIALLVMFWDTQLYWVMFQDT